MQRSVLGSSVLCAYCFAVLSLLLGCGGEPEVEMPSHNRTHITGQGNFVGHLKPLPAPPPGPPPENPVRWVVDGDTVSQPEQEWGVGVFRLDFNEKEPLTEAHLPYVLMTEETKQIIVHRGEPPSEFSHPSINSGERAVPVHQCIYEQCPWRETGLDFAMFPAPDGEQPKCPQCGQSETEPYIMGQHRNMRKFMERHPSK